MTKSSIFNYQNYTKFLCDWVEMRPSRGRGQISQMARHLGISSVSMSYVMNDQRDLSEEQAVELCEFLGLSEIESEYFLALVQFERAGTKKLEKIYQKKLEEIRARGGRVKNRVPAHQELDEKAKALFYSNWYFSGIRLLTSIDGQNNIKTIAETLGLPVSRVREVVEFLLVQGLCIEDENKLQMGPRRTHVDATSSLVASHHRNWRMKALEKINLSDDRGELFFTGPMTLSLETFEELKMMALEFIANKAKKVDPSRSEILACLNIDLFRIT